MDSPNAIPPDELLLAQLACSKLARIAQGIFSVGLAALELKSPSAFLAGKDQVLLGFVEVLRSVTVKPGHAEEIELLGQSTDQLSDLAIQFHSHFLELASWRTMSPHDVRAAGDRLVASYTQFCQALDTLSSRLGAKPDGLGQEHEALDRMAVFLQGLVQQAKPIAGEPETIPVQTFRAR